MRKNEFSSQNSGRYEDVIQNQEHLDKMTVDELTDALSDMWDTMDENDYDSAQIDAYLAELEKREAIVPDFDVDASLATFHEKHARLYEQALPAHSSTVTKPVRCRWRTPLVAAIVAVMLCSLMTVQALGFDVIGAIARWTAETFNFSIFAQSSEDRQNSPDPADGEFSTLQEALDAYGVSEVITPQWYPVGLETVEVSATPRKTGTTIQAIYESGDASISMSVRQYVTAEDALIGLGSFEKDSENVEEYVCNEITHYIFSNNSKSVVTWVNNRVVCSIVGNLTVDELKQMINSIYEG